MRRFSCGLNAVACHPAPWPSVTCGPQNYHYYPILTSGYLRLCSAVLTSSRSKASGTKLAPDPLQVDGDSWNGLFDTWAAAEVSTLSKKRADTVGQPQSAENCPSHMLSLKAQEHREPDIARAAVLRGNRLTNSIRTFFVPRCGPPSPAHASGDVERPGIIEIECKRYPPDEVVREA